MPQLKFINFDQNINECAIAENHSRNTLYLCPNHSSLKVLKQTCQQHCSFNNSTFLTMDDFKLLNMHLELPILKEEKRTLTLYAALKPVFREYFHLNNYFQSISFANEFFNFFEELAEEMISLDDLPIIFERMKTAQNWQQEMFNILLEIRNDYQYYINQRGFTDTIFVKNFANINPGWSDDFDTVVVINQFYFTALEKELLPENKTIIYLQLPEQVYNKSELVCQPEFNASHLLKCRTQSIHNHVFTDEFSLKQGLFDDLCITKPDLIIDFGLLKQHLDKYNCIHLLGGIGTIDFSHSSLFQILEQFHSLLAEIIVQDSQYLIPVNTLISSFSNIHFIKPFLNYIFPDEENNMIIQYQEKLLNFIYYLVDLDYKYFPLSGFISGIHFEPKLRQIFSELKIILDEFSTINSINEFISAITESKLIQPVSIITDQEKKYSDLIEVFYNLVEDYTSLDNINLISDWKMIFSDNSNNRFHRSSQFLRLFLEFSKSKTYKLSTAHQKDKPLQISSLHNTRNLQFDNIFIIDTIEGVIPPARQTPFLLTESQRKLLGLKTYQDILLREKYYLFRVIAQAKNVHFYSRTNPSDRTEISSFLEELKLTLPDIYHQDPLPASALYQEHCLSWLTPVNQDFVSPVIPDNFFTLPFLPDFDLKDGKFFLNPSNIQRLIEQPFNYYLDNMLGLKKRDLLIEMDYTPRQIGNLVHQAFNDMWERIINIDAASHGKLPFKFNQELYTSGSLEHSLINNDQIIFQKPHNYSDLYFDKVIKPLILDSLINFLQLCDERYSGIPIRILPEKSGNDKQKLLFTINSIPVIIKGRADLRIEISSGKENHIYDYKSGKYKSYIKDTYNTQLIMYENLYYNDPDSVLSWLYFTTDQELVPVNLYRITKEEYFIDKMNSLKTVLDNIFRSGFTAGDKKDPYDDDDLSRKQLMKLIRK